MSKTPLFIHIARPTYGRYLLLGNHIKTEGMDILTDMQGPFLVLGNHSHAYDSLFASAAAKVHIRWVAGAYLFKLYGLKTLLGRWVGGISKQQGRSDLETIRAISAALKGGDIVGLFPEGTRTWDGEPVGFSESIAKLVKLFRVPVVIIAFEGIYALKPRWADKKRVGKATLRVLPPISAETINAMTKQELYAYLTETLNFSYREWQERTRTPFRGKAQAEGLQRTLYLCPDCHSFSSLTTKKDLIMCNHCNLKSRLDAHDRFIPIQGNNPFRDVPAWHEWERSQLLSRMEATTEGSPIFPPDKGVLYQKGVDTKLLTLSKDFTLTMTGEGLQVTSNNPPLLALFPLATIQSMIINAKHTIELYCEETLYRIRIDKHGSSLKYVELFHLNERILKQTKEDV